MGLVVMPATVAGAMSLAGSLALYALGLFLPLAVREDFSPEADR
jgi:membrane protein YqaA with SNARE-associated domain